MALDSTSFAKKWQKDNPYLPQVRYRLIIVKAPDSSHIIKSPQAQRDQINVNRRILWEILDTDKRRTNGRPGKTQWRGICRTGRPGWLVTPEKTLKRSCWFCFRTSAHFLSHFESHKAKSKSKVEEPNGCNSPRQTVTRVVRDTAAEGPEPHREADSLASVSGLLHYISLLIDMLVLVFIRCQQNNREPGQKVYAGAKIVALILKLRLLHQPRQTVRYKHLLDLESPLTFIHTSHCLSIRGCSARIAGADSLSISSL
ncbi:hypothetical protein T08_3132 [Trichinella sp. T8]|nr:hypothetical protein T08_3132 [Trichinella sp. T8]